MKPSEVLLDMVGLLAVWERDDQWHSAAVAAYQLLTQTRTRMVTTSFVLLECGNAAARTPYRISVDRLKTQMESAGKLVVPTAEDWRRAWTSYRRGEFDQAGIVDQVSFVVMRRLGLTHAFTNDHHFRAAGFVTLF